MKSQDYKLKLVITKFNNSMLLFATTKCKIVSIKDK